MLRHYKGSEIKWEVGLDFSGLAVFYAGFYVGVGRVD
jgi:hypothetical protein